MPALFASVQPSRAAAGQQGPPTTAQGPAAGSILPAQGPRRIGLEQDLWPPALRLGRGGRVTPGAP